MWFWPLSGVVSVWCPSVSPRRGRGHRLRRHRHPPPPSPSPSPLPRSPPSDRMTRRRHQRTVGGGASSLRHAAPRQNGATSVVRAQRRRWLPFRGLRAAPRRHRAAWPRAPGVPRRCQAVSVRIERTARPRTRLSAPCPSLENKLSRLDLIYPVIGAFIAGLILTAKQSTWEREDEEEGSHHTMRRSRSYFNF